MTEPLLTPYEVERKLLSLSDALDESTEDLIEAETHYVTTKRALEMSLARARVELARDGERRTVQEKDDSALLACEPERVSFDAAEIWVRGSKAQVNKLRAQVDIIRSIGTSVRASMDIT